MACADDDDAAEGGGGGRCRECIEGKLCGKGIYKNECPVCKKPVWLKDLTHNTTISNLVAHYRLIERDLIGAACPDDPTSQNSPEHNSPTSTVHCSPQQQPPSHPPAARSPFRSPLPSPPPELAASPEERHAAARDGDPHDDSPWHGDGEAHVPDSQECQELREENAELEEAIHDIDHLLACAPSPYIEPTTAPSHVAAEGAPVTPAAAGSAGALRNPNSTLRTVLRLLQQGHAMASLTSAQLRLTYRCGSHNIPKTSLRARERGAFRDSTEAPLALVSALTTKLGVVCSLGGGGRQGGVWSDSHTERGVTAAQVVQFGPSHGGGGGDRRRRGRGERGRRQRGGGGGGGSDGRGRG